MDNRDKEFCAITEQGDLGLGAEVFGLADQKILNEQARNNKKKKKNQDNKKD